MRREASGWPQDTDRWIFQSDNPAYQPIRVSKPDISHPILGTMVEVLK
jgi:SOS-response transcriptional repressor LexA